MKISPSIRLVVLVAAIQLPSMVAVGEPTPMDATSAGSDYEKTRAELMERVLQSWQQSGGLEEHAPGAPADTGGRSLQRKLEAISIPAVNFTNVELNRVVSALSALAEEFDLTGEQPKGVNIVLLDPANANPPVSITLRNLTLKRILDFVTDTVGYQYEIQADAVVVRPGGEHTALATEVFPVTRSTVIVDTFTQKIRFEMVGSRVRILTPPISRFVPVYPPWIVSPGWLVTLICTVLL